MSTINPAFTRADRDGLARIGRTLHDLRGIRFAEGDGGGAPAGEQLTDAQAQAILAQAIASGAPKDGAGSDDAAPWTKDNFDPERAGRLVTNLRNDLASEKTKRDQAIKDAVAQAQKDIVASIAQALGGGEQQETDPAKLQQRVTDLSTQVTEKDTALTASQAAVKARDLSIAVLSNPAIRNANPKLLLAHKAFTDSIVSVDPTDEAAITAAINQALQANAALKATPSRSGSGEHQGATVQSLEAQLAAAQKNGDKTETIRLKMELAAARRRARGA